MDHTAEHPKRLGQPGRQERPQPVDRDGIRAYPSGSRGAAAVSTLSRLRRLAAGVAESVRAALLRWAWPAHTRGDAGMSTAEYAVGTIAACGFAALLFKVLSSAEARSMLTALIHKALKLPV